MKINNIYFGVIYEYNHSDMKKSLANLPTKQFKPVLSEYLDFHLNCAMYCRFPMPIYKE